MDYSEFIAQKHLRFKGQPVPYEHHNPALYSFQQDLVQMALTRGRSAVFADCGLGKTLIELEWATNIPGRTLVLAPIAVSHQIESEANRFGYDAIVRAGDDEIGDERITVSNYEKLHRFDPDKFDAVVLDESSILKAYDGKTKAALCRAFAGHRYKLAATATPAPNDFMELGTHSEFLGIMTRSEMLSMFFVHDGGSTQNWRLKGHARGEFWRWVGSWASMIRKPSDLGYDDGGFDLPPLKTHRIEVVTDYNHGALFSGATTLDLQERRRARRASIQHRVDAVSAIVSNGDQWLFWCDLNDESATIKKAIDGTVEVRGSDTEQHKRDSFLGFASGDVPRMVTKPRIGGWGMNWQRCHNMAFVGLSDSYEAFYQATRRCWRFGQEKPVDVYLVYSEAEQAVVDNVLAKEGQHKDMQDALIEEARKSW